MEFVCVSEDKKKEIEPIFIESLQKYVSVIYNMDVLTHFGTKTVYEFSCLIFLIKMFQNI